MQSENGMLKGDIQVEHDLQLNGMVTGSVTVLRGAHFRLNGTACKDLIVEAGSSAEVNGRVSGNVVNVGGDLVIRGVIDGSLKTVSGSTQTDPSARIGSERI